MPNDEKPSAADDFSSLGGSECVTESNVRAAVAGSCEPGRRLALLASLQRGKAATWQLTALGVGDRSRRTRVRRGYLHHDRRGVYSVGFRPRDRAAELWGAVLSASPGSWLCERSALEAAGIWSPRPEDPVNLCVTRPGGLSVPGVAIHRNTRLHPLDTTLIEGIPATTVPRALMDTAPRIGPPALDSCIGRAYRADLLEPAGLRALLGRSRGLRGVALLREATEELWMEPELLRSLLEAKMLRLCRAHRGVPPPLVNTSLIAGGHRVETDFRWPDQRLIIETDGFAFHSDPRAHEADRRRDQDLQLQGWRVYRFTWRQVTRESWRVSRVLRRYFPSNDEKSSAWDDFSSLGAGGRGGRAAPTSA